MHVLCEGGGTLAGALLEAGLVDEFVFFVAPKLLGADGRPVFNMIGLRMDSLKALSILDVKQLEEDMMIRARARE
jgi:diaminohydroxyphosphoribosylaminopyrimidine deaminase/5-amino-6-(5-phosphoribosylamino)uracil reductase